MMRRVFIYFADAHSNPEAVILSPSFGRRASRDISDLIALGMALPARSMGEGASPSAFRSQTSPEILRPKEGLRMTGSNAIEIAVSLKWEYDSPIGDRPVFMRVGNIASTVGNQTFCSEYDRSLRLRVRREMPSTLAAFCRWPEVPRRASTIRSFSIFSSGAELVAICNVGRDS